SPLLFFQIFSTASWKRKEVFTASASATIKRYIQQTPFGEAQNPIGSLIESPACFAVSQIAFISAHTVKHLSCELVAALIVVDWRVRMFMHPLKQTSPRIRE